MNVNEIGGHFTTGRAACLLVPLESQPAVKIWDGKHERELDAGHCIPCSKGARTGMSADVVSFWMTVK